MNNELFETLSKFHDDLAKYDKTGLYSNTMTLNTKYSDITMMIAHHMFNLKSKKWKSTKSCII